MNWTVYFPTQFYDILIGLYSNMSTQRLGDEPFASDEDLFFHKLFAEDELSQRKASETTSMYVNSTYSFHVCKKKGTNLWA
jgi:hypothetical protein